jgi:hypothetical protein
MPLLVDGNSSRVIFKNERERKLRFLGPLIFIPFLLLPQRVGWCILCVEITIRDDRKTAATFLDNYDECNYQHCFCAIPFHVDREGTLWLWGRLVVFCCSVTTSSWLVPSCADSTSRTYEKNA